MMAGDSNLSRVPGRTTSVFVTDKGVLAVCACCVSVRAHQHEPEPNETHQEPRDHSLR